MIVLRVFVLGFVASLATVGIASDGSLNANDVSWLWPVPQNKNDVDKLISMDDLKDSTGKDVWSKAKFDSMHDVIENGGSRVGNREIHFNSSFKNKGTWRVAGMRVDPTAPGNHPGLPGVFGRSPQIRLIVQPVDVISNTQIKVHDVAIHLVYSFVKNPGQLKKEPQDGKFADILNDIDRLKRMSAVGNAPTKNKPLGIHPGLAKPVPGLGDAAKNFLEKHLTSSTLTSLAIMGIANGAEPWFFLALAPKADDPTKFGLIPAAKGPFAKPQMINFLTSPPSVDPKPVVSNRDHAQRRGVATDVLFKPSLPMDQFATIAPGVKDTKVKNKDIADVIANPDMSHFFNTDCVSCHTESQRRNNKNRPIALGDFAFKHGGKSPPIAAECKATQKWNVRNFGWFPDFFDGGKVSPSVTQRTANETAEVLAFIEANFRSDP